MTTDAMDWVRRELRYLRGDVWNPILAVSSYIVLPLAGRFHWARRLDVWRTNRHLRRLLGRRDAQPYVDHLRARAGR